MLQIKRIALGLLVLALCVTAQIITGGGSSGGGGGNIQVNLGNITGAVAMAVTAANNNSYSGTLTGNVTLSQLATPSAGYYLSYDFIENATGGFTITWPAGFSVVPTLSAINIGANCENTFLFRWDGAKAVYQTSSTTCSSGTSRLFNLGICGSNTFGPSDGVTLVSLNSSSCDGDSQAFAAFNATVTQSYAVIHSLPPTGWGGAAVDVKVNWFQTGGVSDGNIQWNFQTFCIAAGGTVAASPTYNTVSTVVVAQPASSVEGEAAVTGVNITGCTATSRMYIKVFNSFNGVGGTTSARVPSVEGVTVTWR